MQDLKTIIRTGSQLSRRAERAALATVVRVTGSAYRRPGARLLISRDGTTVGSVSGGCLERDVALRAKESMDTGQSLLLSYSLSASDDVVFGLGLGCSGSVEVLVEPLIADSTTALLGFLETCLSERLSAVIATVCNIDPPAGATANLGQHLMVASDPTNGAMNWQLMAGGIDDLELRAQLLDDMREVERLGRSVTRQYQLAASTVEALVELIHPPIHLTICGAGDDAIPLITFARQLGWTVAVFDPRSALATSARFPQADLVACCQPSQLELPWKSGQRHAFIVMTHNYSHDLEFLRRLASSRLDYLGVLGPKNRTLKLLQDLSLAGQPFRAEQYASLHAPAGLDIGAETAEEIALSIISEIQTIFARHAGGFLRDKQGAIHAASLSEQDRLSGKRDTCLRSV